MIEQPRDGEREGGTGEEPRESHFQSPTDADLQDEKVQQHTASLVDIQDIGRLLDEGDREKLKCEWNQFVKSVEGSTSAQAEKDTALRAGVRSLHVLGELFEQSTLCCITPPTFETFHACCQRLSQNAGELSKLFNEGVKFWKAGYSSDKSTPEKVFGLMLRIVDRVERAGISSDELSPKACVKMYFKEAEFRQVVSQTLGKGSETSAQPENLPPQTSANSGEKTGIEAAKIEAEPAPPQARSVIPRGEYKAVVPFGETEIQADSRSLVALGMDVDQFRETTRALQARPTEEVAQDLVYVARKYGIHHATLYPLVDQGLTYDEAMFVIRSVKEAWGKNGKPLGSAFRFRSEVDEMGLGREQLNLLERKTTIVDERVLATFVKTFFRDLDLMSPDDQEVLTRALRAVSRDKSGIDKEMARCNELATDMDSRDFGAVRRRILESRESEAIERALTAARRAASKASVAPPKEQVEEGSGTADSAGTKGAAGTESSPRQSTPPPDGPASGDDDAMIL